MHKNIHLMKDKISFLAHPVLKSWCVIIVDHARPRLGAKGPKVQAILISFYELLFTSQIQSKAKPIFDFRLFNIVTAWTMDL